MWVSSRINSNIDSALKKFIYKFFSRDEQLFKSFETYLGCGSLEKTSREVVNFNVRKISDILTVVIPFYSEGEASYFRCKVERFSVGYAS